MTDKNFYITTPLYYVNDQPHLGTAYSTVIADILNRYHKMFGKKTFFLTGTDEHGQKCVQAASEKGLSPQAHCDQMSPQFEKTWQALGIQYDLFFRTSFKWHKQAVQKAMQILYDKGDIYFADYQGWYCVSEEIFYTEKDLVEGKSPTGKDVIHLKEKAWFFKMSTYHKRLNQYLEDYPRFIQPKSRYNEITGFLKKPLQDLCISRPKKRVSWGVELPFDKDCVAYVWVDALLNYITGIGWSKDEKAFEQRWQTGEQVHLIGKDILMTHAVYWPCLLMALDLPLPTTIFAHGWLLNKESKKMSKSKGDRLDPLELLESLGVCELRYFLAKGVILGKDSATSKSLMIAKINEDLAGNMGNIFSRVCRMIEQHFKGVVPKATDKNQEDFDKKHKDLQNKTEKLCGQFQKQIENFELSQALEAVLALLSEVNRYLEQEAPWKQIKTDKNKAGFVLYNALEVLRICAILLFPVMPQKMKQLLLALGEKPDFKNIRWGCVPLDKPIQRPEPLFPRIQTEGVDILR